MKIHWLLTDMWNLTFFIQTFRGSFRIIVIIFKSVHRLRWWEEGGGVNGHLTLFKYVDYDALHFNMRLLKINIFKVFFWEGGGHKKDHSL